MMINEFDLLIKSIKKSVLNDDEEFALINIDYRSLLRISKFHDVSHLVYYALKDNNHFKECKEYCEFKKCYDLALIRDVRRDYGLKLVKHVFKKIKKPFIILKGPNLLTLYPKSWMRTSADIDIFIKKDDLTVVTNAFTKLGAGNLVDGAHHLSFDINGDIHIEIHYLLIEEKPFYKAYNYLINVWNNALLKDNDSYEYSLSLDDSYIYHIVHMAKHFINGGCGIRSIIDLYLINELLINDFDSVDCILKDIGLFEFKKQMSELAINWFNNTNDLVIDDLGLYIINGGIYGTIKQNVIVKKTTNKRFLYYFKRIFLPFKMMKRKYYVLSDLPFLLPIFWIIRLFRLFKKGTRNKVLEEINAEKSINKSDVVKTKELLNKLGIDYL